MSQIATITAPTSKTIVAGYNKSQTQMRKSSDGWEAKTFFQIPDGEKAWEVFTYKYGKFIKSSCQAMKIKPDGTITFTLFQDKSAMLQVVTAMGTEKNVQAAHAAAVAKFELLTEKDFK